MQAQRRERNLERRGAVAGDGVPQALAIFRVAINVASDSLEVDREVNTAVKNHYLTCKVFVLSIALTVLALAPMARATEPIASDDPTTSLESSDPNQVLEIPQQCDKDAVASLCDRPAASDASASSSTDPLADPSQVTTAAPADPAQAVPQNSDVGSIDDYQNQNVPEASGGPVYVAVPEPVYIPQYSYLSPGPVIVPNGSFAGPRYVQPGPLGFQPGGVRPGGYGGFGSFGPRPFGARAFGGVGVEFGGGHFAGRR